ncbi:MAG: hypothetical protein JY451_07750 [Erythrobacter sp.]|nr:MAG: hypothetical protein JY451_07750 [Erythrobacter sp.]
MTDEEGRAIDRRAALRLALAAALAPATISAQARAQQFSGGLIAPPTDPMRYSRIVSRDLVDGRSFRVARSFAVEFRRFDQGFMLHGRQVEVAVYAPAPLAQFAELERSRDESGLFPIALDPFGRILSPGSDLGDQANVGRAVERAFAALSRQQLAQDERATLEGFVAALHAAGGELVAHLPVDLFAPAGSPRQREQQVALPDGSQGRVLTRFEAELDDATGLMRSAQREVVTEVNNTRRATSESWSLALASGSH